LISQCAVRKPRYLRGADPEVSAKTPSAEKALKTLIRIEKNMHERACPVKQPNLIW